MAQIPSMSQGPLGSMSPHRGVLILVLGILGIVICFICGIVAWIMGNADLRAMNEGRMDPTGLGLTKAGKICGIIGTVLGAITVLYIVFVMILGVGMAAAGAAGAAAGGGTP